ncbi:hypothetical protein GXM_10285 [Nostoc sphaeroides CCNUC1]|uniref:Uncharacterized protein n=1 Tax=Nostoc sphaeroides CCNUC1 TaxID=2653204 RepID=A0A5P8WIX3_9NOSO|nr:hypothetical protein GXM_10285 [Nostoc sphaeroides CCNUC1]
MVDSQTINPLALSSDSLKKRCLCWAMPEQLSTTSKIHVAINSEKILLN